ncbi:hypothetical protein PQX77_011090 [Marasmius sp. AFHP31]|nr:hypothetical protein PQX77_011090 [Marasmius sp. AFHP31]
MATRYVLSTRNAEGEGWHKRGHRYDGDMWIIVKMGTGGHTRGQYVNEHLTLSEVWRQILESVVEEEEGFQQLPFPEGWVVGLFSRGRLVPETDDLVTTIFDGGNTITVKVLDEDNYQLVYDLHEDDWVYYEPQRQPQRRQPRIEAPAFGGSTRNFASYTTSGWHGYDWRSAHGEMWINVRMDTDPHSEGQLFRENLTLHELWGQVRCTLNMNAGFPLPRGWELDLYLDSDPVPRTNRLIASVFNGGETIDVVVYDQDGQQRAYVHGEGWVYVE